MRIARLDLTRYGRFSDYKLDFGPAPANGPDFHIVYGLNEAGKSTAAAAILDLLFGIEKQSPYGAPKGRASATGTPIAPCGSARGSSSRGGAYEVARLKRDKNSLVDADNRPLDETFLKAELAGVDRAAFRMMFSLDDESLEKGGEAILESRGDLGQLLFSASAGLAEMQRPARRPCARRPIAFTAARLEHRAGGKEARARRAERASARRPTRSPRPTPNSCASATRRRRPTRPPRGR